MSNQNQVLGINARRQNLHNLACEVVAEWALKNNMQGKAGRMARKCRIDKLEQRTNSREEMRTILGL